MKRFRSEWMLLSSLVAAPLAAEDWPQYRGQNQNGISNEKISKWPEAGPRPVWKTALRDGFSSLAVSGGKAFTLVARDVEGVAREVCLALEADTGKELWATPVAVAKYDGGGERGEPDNDGGDGPRSTPAVDGNKVYVLSSKLVLSCFDAQTGKQAWARDLIKEHDGKLISWQNAASPILEGDLIYVAGGGNGQSLLAIHKETGKTVWSGENDKMTHASPVPATIHGVRQVIFLTQSGLVAVEAKQGKVLWRHPFKYNVSTAASPVVEKDIVFCSAGYGVGATAVRIEKAGPNFSAKELWRNTGNTLANHWSTPVVKNGYLYGMFSFKEFGGGPLKCVELATGKEMWSKPGFGPGNVILSGSYVIALNDRGEIKLVETNPQSYTEVARAQVVSGKCWSTPSLSNGRLYVRSTKEGACVDIAAKVSGK